ncbi:hypothetical protein VTP01DRAFT_3591 [Rhizomucor pusillus]|uniref:uncharacterized protein n=1 Tax=Rhizomucor pusillus TaxID=4840 RepID=UPI003742281F
MYNGIGLSTPRGSGTNGYVQRNLSYVRPPKTDHLRDAAAQDLKPPTPVVRAANKEILLHDRKRKVEVKCMELRIKLEDEGLSEADIEEKIQELRNKLMEDFDKVEPREAKSLQEHETHQRNAAKEIENKKMMQALKIREDYVEGAAFDRELQEQKRQEKIARRQAEQARLIELEEKKRSRRRRSRSPDRKRRERSPDERRRRRRSPSTDSEEERRSRRRHRSPSIDSERERSSRRRRHRSPSTDSEEERRSRRRRRSPSTDSEEERRYSRRRRSPSSDFSEEERRYRRRRSVSVSSSSEEETRGRRRARSSSVSSSSSYSSSGSSR